MPGGAHQFQRGGPLQRFVEHGVDAVLGIAHGFLRVAAHAVDARSGCWKGRCARPPSRDSAPSPRLSTQASNFSLRRRSAALAGHDHGFNAELPEAFGQQNPGRFIQTHQGSAGGWLSDGRNWREGSGESFIHSRGEDSTFKTIVEAVAHVEKTQRANQRSTEVLITFFEDAGERTLRSENCREMRGLE